MSVMKRHRTWGRAPSETDRELKEIPNVWPSCPPNDWKRANIFKWYPPGWNPDPRFSPHSWHRSGVSRPSPSVSTQDSAHSLSLQPCEPGRLPSAPPSPLVSLVCLYFLAPPVQSLWTAKSLWDMSQVMSPPAGPPNDSLSGTPGPSPGLGPQSHSLHRPRGSRFIGRQES